MNVFRRFGRYFQPKTPSLRYHDECGEQFPPPVKTGHYKLYQLAFYFIGLPAVIVASLWNYREYEHEKKCYKRPPFIKYSFRYRRTKRFPWGDGNKSFFHNKLKNALPEGYED